MFEVSVNANLLEKKMEKYYGKEKFDGIEDKIGHYMTLTHVEMKKIYDVEVSE